MKEGEKWSIGGKQKDAGERKVVEKVGYVSRRGRTSDLLEVKRLSALLVDGAVTLELVGNRSGHVEWFKRERGVWEREK